MRIFFRADASFRIGSGHVMRCLTLANAMRELGDDVSFVCRDYEGNLSDMIAGSGFAVHRLPNRSAGSTAEAEWLGASWEDDAAETGAAVASVSAVPDWLVVDHYGIDRRWERAMRPLAERIMVIDDLANRPHECDVLLDQNYVAAMGSRYAGLVSPDCKMLLGPTYGLLQNEYVTVHDRVRLRAGPIRRLLIYFGAADTDNLTGRTLTAFLGLGRTDIHVDVVIRANSPFAGEIRRQAAGHATIRVHDSLPSLASMMADADVAVGAAGATTWERCCVGLPALVVTLADNQRPIAAALRDLSVVRWLGDTDEAGESTIATALRDVLERGLEPDWSRRCWNLVDGRGTQRVLRVTSGRPSPTNELMIRRAVLGDADLLLTWRNDPSVVVASRVSSPVSPAEHARWIESVLTDPDRTLYIVESGGQAAGTVRVDRHPDGQELSWTVAPAARGRGIGKTMVKMVADMLIGVVYADVKGGNEASAAIAVHAGLTLDRDDDDMQRYVRRA